MASHEIVFNELWHCPACGVAEESFSSADFMLIEPYFEENGLDPKEYIRDLCVGDPSCSYVHGGMITSEFWGTEANEQALKDWFFKKYGKHLGLSYTEESGEESLCGACSRW